MISEKAFVCAPYDFHGKFYIYPPTMNDVINNELFGICLDVLTKTQEDIEDFYNENNKVTGIDTNEYPTPYSFLLMSCYHSKDFERYVREAFMLFTHQEVTFLYEANTILIGSLPKTINKMKRIEDLNLLEEKDFFEFQNAIREITGEDPVEPPEDTTKMDPRIRRMKALARYRDRVKQKKEKGISLSTSLAAICCMGIGINPLNIGELSYAAFRKLMNVYQQKEEYELDIQSLLAGADSNKVKPKYWIRNKK